MRYQISHLLKIHQAAININDTRAQQHHGTLPQGHGNSALRPTSMTNDVTTMPAHTQKPEIFSSCTDPTHNHDVIDLEQARLLIAALENALKTSNTLVHALLDGSANDKKIGKYILKTARQTDALLDQQVCQQLQQWLNTLTIAQIHDQHNG